MDLSGKFRGTIKIIEWVDLISDARVRGTMRLFTPLAYLAKNQYKQERMWEKRLWARME